MDFKYSPQLNNALGGTWTKAFNKNKESTETRWEKEGGKIIKTLESVLGLKLPKKLTVYVNTEASFSEPLAIKIEKDIDDNIDNLTHELIHVILTHNFKKIEKKWITLMQKYEKEKPLTRRHIPIHAIHLKVAGQLGFGKDRIDRIKTYSKNPAYLQSWKIVNKESADRIIQLLV